MWLTFYPTGQAQNGSQSNNPPWTPALDISAMHSDVANLAMTDGNLHPFRVGRTATRTCTTLRLPKDLIPRHPLGLLQICLPETC